MNDVSLVFALGVLVGILLAGAVGPEKAELETKEPVKEERYERGLYEERYVGS